MGRTVRVLQLPSPCPRRSSRSWRRGTSSAAGPASCDPRSWGMHPNLPDIDGWEIRKAYQELVDEDLVPDPTIVAAALRACRRVNDYSLTTRILEITEQKSQINKEIWPYMIQELKPTLDELGILTPEEMGYNKPELWMPNPYEG